ncbi:MAG: hypothetical protein AB7S63_15525 [Thauera sp.]
MILGVLTKQPSERRDIDLTFAKWLAKRPGDSLASAVSAVDPAGLAVESPVVASPIVKQWFSGGVDGQTYKVTVTVTTTQGRIEEVEFKVRVREV